jgi:uncharacterized protein YegL
MVNPTSSFDPLGAVSGKPLHFFWLVDCSGSMAGDKIQSVNQTVREVLPATRDSARNNPFAQLLMRVIKFSSGASWQVGTPTAVEAFQWKDLSASGVTDLGAALRLLAGELEPDRIGKRALPPVIVLLTDGCPTDDWEQALDALNAKSWGKPGRTVRVAIAIGRDGIENKDVLTRFTGNPETVFDAHNAQQLKDLIRWASVTLSSYVSSGKSRTGASESSVVIPPAPVPASAPTSGTVDDQPW